MEKVKEILKSSLLLLIIVTFSANILGESVLTAYAASDPLDTIRQYVEYLGHDWNKAAELYVSGKAESNAEFFNNEECINSNVGILNVNNAELVESVKVEYEDVAEYLETDYTDKEVKIYAVGIDYSVNEDSVFYSNGVSYEIISLVLENDEWKICETAQIFSPEELLEKGYVFSEEYNCTIEMMEARESGILMNGNGEVFDNIGEIVEIEGESTEGTDSALASTLSASVATMALEDHATNAASHGIGIPTASTPVYLGYYNSSDKDIFIYYVDANANGVNYPSAVSFERYCIGVAAGECRHKDFDRVARRAIIMAIKTYTWYHLIYPSDSTHGVHIKVWNKNSNAYGVYYTGQQAYAPHTVSENPQVTVDYNVVKNIWMESGRGNIFNACHRAVYFENETDEEKKIGYSMYRSKDDSTIEEDFLNQHGCRYLYDKKRYSMYKILKYYYSESSHSYEEIIFFTSSGRTIYK